MTPNEERLQARSERAEARARLKAYVWNALAPIRHPETRVTAYDALATEAECGTFHSRWFQVGHYIIGVLGDEFTPTIAIEEMSPFQRRWVGGDALPASVSQVGSEGGFEHAAPIGAMLCSARFDEDGEFLAVISSH
jgi:hypothetical protein